MQICERFRLEQAVALLLGYGGHRDVGRQSDLRRLRHQTDDCLLEVLARISWQHASSGGHASDRQVLHDTHRRHASELWWGSCWPGRHRQNRDHQGLGQGLGSACHRLQLLGWFGLQDHGPLLQWLGAGGLMGVLRRVQPNSGRGAERDRPADVDRHPGHSSEEGRFRILGQRHPAEQALRCIHHDEPGIRWPSRAARQLEVSL
mmetsp:Transcript_49834/g.161197  ORF Transcript_49834/g.161197 Transcript_49834/m.161197 type:complete len:204 (-) Transcript_49834:7943-8554(-)